MQNLKLEKAPPWNHDDLDSVLRSLKNNKTKDPNGMINEIFKAGCIGSDMKDALTKLFNGVRANQFLPLFMALSNITSLFKNKGSRFDLNNDRGIFILTVLKKILDKLIYFDNYQDLDKNMSDSNIGFQTEEEHQGPLADYLRGDQLCHQGWRGLCRHTNI